MAFKHISIAQYQEVRQFLPTTDDKDAERALTAWCRVLSVITGKPYDDIESWPIERLKAAINKIKWIKEPITGRVRKYLWFGLRPYKATLSTKGMSTAQCIEIKTFLARHKGDYINAMHMVLASIYTPLTWRGWSRKGLDHEDLAFKFQNRKVSEVAPSVFFYSKELQRSINRIREYGIKIQAEKMREAEQLLMSTLREILENIGDGMPQSTNSPEATHLKKMKYGRGL